MITRLFAALIHLYPRQFQAEFGEEMTAVFEQVEAAVPREEEKLSRFLRELRDLPGSLLEAYVANWLRGANMFTIDDSIKPSTRWQSFLGMLPFLVFGIMTTIIETDPTYNFRDVIYLQLAFYLLSLGGFLVGWIRGFPLWSYSYLGWSLVFAWWWTNMHTGGMKLFGYVFTRQEAWGWRIWIPLGVVILLALLWTRSLTPIKKFFREIWNDWTRLMLVMFALETWVLMIYDENHHPYLLAFILASTLVTSSGVWFFLRSSTLWKRILSLVSSFIAAAVIGGIAWTTWSWHEYYGFPKPEHWYEDWGISVIGVTLWLVILFWPVLIALIKRIIPRRAG